MITTCSCGARRLSLQTINQIMRNPIPKCPFPFPFPPFVCPTVSPIFVCPTVPPFPIFVCPTPAPFPIFVSPTAAPTLPPIVSGLTTVAPTTIPIFVSPTVAPTVAPVVTTVISCPLPGRISPKTLNAIMQNPIAVCPVPVSTVAAARTIPFSTLSPCDF